MKLRRSINIIRSYNNTFFQLSFVISLQSEYQFLCNAEMLQNCNFDIFNFFQDGVVFDLKDFSEYFPRILTNIHILFWIYIIKNK